MKTILLFSLLLFLTTQKLLSQYNYTKYFANIYSSMLNDEDLLMKNDSITGGKYTYQTFLNEISTHVPYYNIVVNGRKRKLYRDSVYNYVQTEINYRIANTILPVAEGFTELKDTLQKQIYFKIRLLEKKTKFLPDSSEYTKLTERINKLTPSKEKIWLFFQCKNLKLKNNYSELEINQSISKTKLIAKNISDIYEKGKAYSYIGDFASKYQVNTVAIELYYTAKKYIYFSKKDSTLKNLEQGILDERLSDIFDQRIFYYNLAKKLVYNLSAIYYYFDANDSDRANLCAMKLLADWVYSKYDLSDNKNLDNDYELQMLKGISSWYQDYKETDSLTGKSLDDYLGLYSLATILRVEKKYDIALSFYLEALLNILFIDDEKIIFQLQKSIYNISFIYALQGKEQLSNEYWELAQKLANKTNEKSSLSWNILGKSFNFYHCKRYDSALILANKIQYDTSLRINLPKPFYKQLIGFVFVVKAQIFESIHSDSSGEYNIYYKNNISEYLEEFTSLLQMDAIASQDWMEHIKNNDKNISDSLNTDIIVKEKEKGRKNKINSYYIFGALGLTIAIIVTYFIWKRIIEKKKANAEYDRLNELAKNKIHNIQNDNSVIGNLLAENKTEQAKKYVNAYDSFLALFLENWKKDKQITLRDELNAFERYFELKKTLNERLLLKVDYLIENLNPDSVLFIQSVFDTLLDNSFKHGFDEKTGDLLFSVTMKSKSGFLYCTITDNGIPPENDVEYLKGNGHGLDTLKKRILLFYTLHKKKLPDVFFKINSLPGKDGTLITLIIPLCKS